VNITHKTIEELIKLAYSKPKARFTHCFEGIDSQEDASVDGIEFVIIRLQCRSQLNWVGRAKNLIFYSSKLHQSLFNQSLKQYNFSIRIIFSKFINKFII
jgi:hypothetical protein